MSDELFDHKKAQQYEIGSARNTLIKNFKKWYSKIESVKANKEMWPGFGELKVNGFYGDSQETWMEFAKYIEGKTCLEIGPGPCGSLASRWWVKRRILIDPLIEEYNRITLELFQKSIYTEDMELYAQPAEKLIPSLVGIVDGAIICRNALDHLSDPMLVLKNIAAYAKSGCYLLLWTDLWHLGSRDAGHRNITEDKEGFKKNIMDLGFEILYSFDGVRQDGSTIEYGCRARKIV